MTTDYKYYNHLGFLNPFYLKNNHDIKSYFNISDAIKNQNENVLDSVGILELFCNGYNLGDRTIINGLYKTPWMSKPDINNNDWDLYELPKHNNLIYDNIVIAEKFYELLKEELILYCEGSKSIGILLSGGMDSRITAGILNNLIQNNSINAKVVAITWGSSDSRDFQYAQRIAKLYNWDWINFNIDSETLFNNIIIAGNNGCQYAPFHLHAMDKVSKIQGVDCILASSFGDSIGRGVYSSRHLTELFSVEKFFRNWFGLVYTDLFKNLKKQMLNDVKELNDIFPREEKWQQLELQQQSFYWRRLLNPCFSIINNNIPVYQTFSSPEVYSYIWSLSPKVRTDYIYLHLVNKYMSELSDIPWSKTGIPYLSSDKNSKPDNLQKDHHNYSYWIRNDLSDYIESLIFNDRITNLKIFDLDILEYLFKKNKELKNSRLSKIDNFIIWLSSLSIFMDEYNIKNADFNGSKKSSKFMRGIEFIAFEKLVDIKKSFKK
jgi:asparagine synthase (glutamine-hydrolysing)